MTQSVSLGSVSQQDLAVQMERNALAQLQGGPVDGRRDRALAVSAGDYRVSVMREVHRMLAQAGDNQLEAARSGLDRLVADGLITTHDRKHVDQMCADVFSLQRGEVAQEDASAKIRVTYDQMLVDTTTSPVALAIASIASSGSTPELPADIGLPKNTLAKISRSDKIDMGIVGGAIAGAAIGGAIGGFGGAVAGAVVGGIAGGVGTACAT
jgi:hypothetical protein